MTAAFLQTRADLILALDDNTREKTDIVLDRTAELLDDPDQRDPDVVRLALNYTAERYEQEFDNATAALQLRTILAEYFARTWQEILNVPAPRRGTNYQTARQLVLMTCYNQATVELLAVDALSVGDDMGANNAKAADRMNKAQIKKMATTGGVEQTPGQVAAEEAEPEESEEDGA